MCLFCSEPKGQSEYPVWPPGRPQYYTRMCLGVESSSLEFFRGGPVATAVNGEVVWRRE